MRKNPELNVDDRITVNDTLTALLPTLGASLADDDLNELTHRVADFIEQHPRDPEETP